LFEKANETAEKSDKLVFFKYSSETKLSAEIANKLIYKWPNKIIAVAYVHEERANISFRGRRVRMLVEKALSCKADASAIEEINKAVAEAAEKGLSVKELCELANDCLENQVPPKDVAEIIDSYRSTCLEGVPPKEVTAIIEAFLEKGQKSKEDIEKILDAVVDAYNKDASARQIRILVDDCLKKDVDTSGLEQAIESLGLAVDKGMAPEDARVMVAFTAVSGVKDGIKGEELAKQIEETVNKYISESAKIEKEVEKKYSITDARKEWTEQAQQQKWDERITGGTGEIKPGDTLIPGGGTGEIKPGDTLIPGGGTGGDYPIK